MDPRGLAIRRNCDDALRQALAYSPQQHLWIDSIYVNQRDNHEKGHQVQMMYNIYKNASKVLACVGEHTDGSEMIVKPSHTSDDVWDESSDKDAKLAELEDPPSLRKAMHPFATRPYWQRLWIIQEIIAGADEVQVLCGHDSLPMEDLDDICYLAKEIENTPLANVLNLRNGCRISGKCSLRTILLSTGNTLCEDPRDRLYGLLNIMHWPLRGEDVESIAPDYSLTVWDLALELVRKTGPLNCASAMYLFKITSNTPELRALLDQRSQPMIPMKKKDNSTAYNLVASLATITIDHRGVLQLPLEGKSGEDADDRFVQALQIVKSPEECAKLGIMSRTPLQVIDDRGLVCGLVCSETRSGDIIMFTSYNDNEPSGGRCLVLRGIQDTCYDVVGAGYLGDSWVDRVHPYSQSRTPELDLKFRLKMMKLRASPQDILTIFHSDHAVDPASRALSEVLCLTRSPLQHPKGEVMRPSRWDADESEADESEVDWEADESEVDESP